MTQHFDSNQVTRDYFDSMLLETRYIDSDLPDTKVTFWGETFDTPIMTAALSHLYSVYGDGMVEFAKGAKLANAMHFMGMAEDSDLEQVIATGAKTVKIIKPHSDNGIIFQKIVHANKHGAFAVGMDIDHAYNAEGDYDMVCGLPMKSKSLVEMREFVHATDLPFIIKGVLSTRDAEKSVEAGAKAIIVSHHHGIMPYSVPPLMILPEIVKAVDGQVKIIVDCGIESGMDVFKALALGADAVCVGRNLMDALKGGSISVGERMQAMTRELASIMARTGAHSIAEIDPSVIHYYK